MEKIAKYCSSCDEGFAEKFGFCPNCALPLQAFEGPAFKNYEPQYTLEDDGGYYVTVIQEKGAKQRNLILFASTFLILTLSIGATIVSLFQKNLGIGAIGDERSLASLIDQVPMTVEQEPKTKKDDDDGGGGGGGGNENPDPVSKGKMPAMTRDPQMAPSTSMDRLTNPTIPVQMSIKGPERKSDAERYGYDTSRFEKLSDGNGTGGGIGGGVNGGFGDGRNPGGGTGSEGGLGGGREGGIGDDEGVDGTRTRTLPPPPVGVTTPVKIISKPQAKYNEAGRSNFVQGSVRLRITLLANGSIGLITPVTRLPHGLTEQAIAAARQLRFEPKKVNGVPQPTIVTVDYSFSIY